MRDPVTKLAIVDPSSVDPAIAKMLPTVFFSLNSRVPLCLYASRFTSKGRFGFSEARVMLVSNAHIFIFDDPSGSLSRCVPIAAISAVLLFQDGYNVLKVPTEHDVIFKLQSAHEVSYFVNILSVAKSFLPALSEGAATNDLLVKALSQSYSDLSGPNAVVLTKRSDAAYATVPIPTIRLIDAQKGDTITEFLKVPPPPTSKGPAGAAVSADSARYQQVLQHPLFHPSGAAQKTAEDVKQAQAAIAGETKTKAKAVPTQQPPPAPAAAAVVASPPRAQEPQLQDVQPPSMGDPQKGPPLGFSPLPTSTPLTSASPRPQAPAQTLPMSADQVDGARRLLLQKFQHSDLGAVPPPPPPLSVAYGPGMPPPPAPTATSSRPTTAPPLRGPPTVAAAPMPEIATVISIQHPQEPFFSDAARLAALEERMQQLQEENRRLRDTVAQQQRGVVLPAGPSASSSRAAAAAGDPVSEQTQTHIRPAAIAGRLPGAPPPQEGPLATVTRTPFPGRRSSAALVERAVLGKSPVERAAIRQYHIDQLTSELDDLRRGEGAGSSMTKMQTMIAIGEVQDDLMELAQAMAADEAAALEVIEPHEQSSPASPPQVAADMSLTSHSNAQAYAAWYYYQYLPSVAAAIHSQPQSPAPSGSGLVKPHLVSEDRRTRLEDLYSADDDAPPVKSSARRRHS
jgi:hypothetical protein